MIEERVQANLNTRLHTNKTLRKKGTNSLIKAVNVETMGIA